MCCSKYAKNKFKKWKAVHLVWSLVVLCIIAFIVVLILFYFYKIWLPHILKEIEINKWCHFLLVPVGKCG